MAVDFERPVNLWTELFADDLLGGLFGVFFNFGVDTNFELLGVLILGVECIFEL